MDSIAILLPKILDFEELNFFVEVVTPMIDNHKRIIESILRAIYIAAG